MLRAAFGLIATVLFSTHLGLATPAMAAPTRPTQSIKVVPSCSELPGKGYARSYQNDTGKNFPVWVVWVTGRNAEGKVTSLQLSGSIFKTSEPKYPNSFAVSPIVDVWANCGSREVVDIYRARYAEADMDVYDHTND